MRDPEFLEEAKKESADIRPMSGADLQTLATKVVRTRPEIVARMLEMLAH